MRIICLKAADINLGREVNRGPTPADAVGAHRRLRRADVGCQVSVATGGRRPVRREAEDAVVRCRCRLSVAAPSGPSASSRSSETDSPSDRTPASPSGGVSWPRHSEPLSKTGNRLGAAPDDPRT